MKRNTLFYTIPLALIAALALCFVGCYTPADTEGTVTVVIGEEGNFDEYEISLSEVEITDGVLSLLIYLEENEGVELDYANSTYGAFLNSVGGLTPNSLGGEYIGVYTSVESDFDVSVFAGSYEYKSITLSTAGVGVSSMKVEAGATYLFKIDTYVG
jgi:hypothetical protein